MGISNVEKWWIHRKNTILIYQDYCVKFISVVLTQWTVQYTYRNTTPSSKMKDSIFFSMISMIDWIISEVMFSNSNHSLSLNKPMHMFERKILAKM